LFAAVAAIASFAQAGGPRNVNGLGQPMAWPAGTVTYNVDPGSLGSLNNTDARALVSEAFNVWRDAGRRRLLFDNFENSAPGWTAYSDTSAPTFYVSGYQQPQRFTVSALASLYGSPYSGIENGYFQSPLLPQLPANSVLRFQQLVRLDDTHDGGLLEISTNGTTWNDLGPQITLGGYNGTISNCCASPIAGRSAWTGISSGFQAVEVDLSSYAGSNVRVRFRLSRDNHQSVAIDLGWYIDDVEVLTRPNAVHNFASAAALPQDINAAGRPATNPAHYRNFWRKSGDGRAPLIFDQDGAIIDDLFGEGARLDILGAAVLDTPTASLTTISEASLVINGLFFDGAPSPTDLTRTGLKAVIVHEIGHWLNLDHSLLNHELAGNGIDADDIYLPTMFPLIVDDEEQLATLTPDDQAAYLDIYAPGPANGISGSVSFQGVTYQGAEVVLRRVGDPFGTVYSTFAGGRYFPCNAGSTCDPCNTACNPGHPASEGAFELRNLVPGDYEVCVKQIDASPGARGVVGPLAEPKLMPGPEECWDVAESGASTDDPDAVSAVSTPSSTVNISLNVLPASDSFEPSSIASPAALPAIATLGYERLGATLTAGDVDAYSFSVEAGQQLTIDLDAAELGSSLDAVIGLYDNNGVLIATSDDAADPESRRDSKDSALSLIVGFTGTAKLAISAFPDADFDGSGQASTGAYWLAVATDLDADRDGTVRAQDGCRTVSGGRNTVDLDLDGLPDACDPDQDGDGILDKFETDGGVYLDAQHTGTDPRLADTDQDGVSDSVEIQRGTDPNSVASATSLFGAPTVLGANGSRAVAADYDLDGDLDLLQSSSSALVYRVNDGTGNFTTVTLGSGAAFDGVAWARLYPSALLSAIAVRNGTVVVYDNTAGPGSVIDPAFTGASDVATGDIDGDGDIDIVSASSTAHRVVWFESRRIPDETNLFVTHTIASGGPDAFGPIRVVVADFNLDGKLDVAYSGSASFVYERDNLGGGTFGPAIDVNSFGDSVLLATDHNQDGRPDLTMAGSSGSGGVITRYRDGGITPWFNGFTTGELGYAANSVAIADIDGDGQLDMAMTSTTQPARWYSRFIGSVPHQFSESSTARNGLVLADFDRDGDPDAVYLDLGSGSVKLAKSQRNHSKARFDFDLGIDEPSPPPTQLRDVGWANIDRDGSLDPVFCEGTGRVAWLGLQGTSNNAGTHEVASDAGDCRFINVVDLDADSDSDLVVVSGEIIYWYANDGTGQFGVRQTLFSFTQGLRTLLFTDLDQDGREDLITAELTGGLTVARNHGGGSFSSRESVDYSWVADQLAAGDVDRDGIIDIVAAGEAPFEVSWYRGGLPEDFDLDGTVDLNYVEAPRVSIGSSSFAHGLGLADIDRDGTVDVVACTNDGTIRYRYTVDPHDPQDWTSIVESSDPCSGSALADLDKDGDIDQLYVTDTFDVAELRNNGSSLTGPFSTNILFDPYWDLADFDHDGDPDLLQGASNLIRLAPNDASWYLPKFADVAPPNINDGQSALMLRLDVEHRGIATDSTLAITKLQIGYTGNGSYFGMEPNQASAIFSSIDTYSDDGDGTFESNQDTLISHLTRFDANYTVATFVPDDLAVQIPPGQTKRYFISVTTTPDASLQALHDFRLYATIFQVVDTNSGTASPDAGTVGNVSRLVACDRPSAPAFVVNSAQPASGTQNVSTASEFLVQLNRACDPSTATAQSVYLEANSIKVPANVIVDASGTQITLDPIGGLATLTSYTLHVTNELLDTAGVKASPFLATYTTWQQSGGGSFGSSDVGGQASGGQIGGSTPGEELGAAVAAVGDIDGDGIGDIVTGSPGTDIGPTADVGKVTVTFGSTTLQNNGSQVAFYLQGEAAGDRAGSTVARAGLMNADTLAELAIGAPDAGGAAGRAYVVFGSAALRGQAGNTLLLSNLAACAQPTVYCGVKFVGEAAGDRAGASIAFAGDINADGKQDLLIGAPGADPLGRSDAGKVYLIFGPLSAGTVLLSNVGGSVPGRVFYGENAGDRAGEAVSWWLDPANFDDYLIGAPGATPVDEFNTPIPGAGVVYAIHGGASNLTGGTPPSVIELSRVANGLADQINGYVFIGTQPGQKIGRSLTGAVDVTGDGVADIAFGAEGQAWAIPGEDPKSVSGVSGVKPPALPDVSISKASRPNDGSDAVRKFGAVAYLPGAEGAIGPTVVGGGGDLDGDGRDDLMIGAPQADPAALTDAGSVYIVSGSRTPRSGERLLSDIGVTIAGFKIAGVQAGMQLGGSVGGGFDVNGDGLSDALFGAPRADRGGPLVDAGIAYVLSPVSPPEVALLKLQRNGATTTLEWTRAARAVGYNVYRESVATLSSVQRMRTSDALQLSCGINTDTDSDGLPDTTDAASPAPGQAFAYVVTGKNLHGESLLGITRGASTRLNDAPCP
jgi:hypothetical protein